MRERAIIAIKNRILQGLAMSLPGGKALRVTLHRLRGVTIGDDVWIGSGALIETACPKCVTIGNRVVIGIRATILAHFQELTGVEIEDDVDIGAYAVDLPGVIIGKGSVVRAGSVVTRSIPPMTVVQGNPAVRVARCKIPLGLHTSRLDFMRNLKPLS
jgi:acetyltransferase-like isoleucine patch superfamily enzyme